MSSLPAPASPPPPRFPVIAIVAPLVISALLFLILRSSYVLIFALLGPVMALSSWWEARRAHRAEIARHEKAQRERDEEERAQEKRRKREEIRQLETRFPTPPSGCNNPCGDHSAPQKAPQSALVVARGPTPREKR